MSVRMRKPWTRSSSSVSFAFLGVRRLELSERGFVLVPSLRSSRSLRLCPQSTQRAQRVWGLMRGGTARRVPLDRKERKDYRSFMIPNRASVLKVT